MVRNPVKLFGFSLKPSRRHDLADLWVKRCQGNTIVVWISRHLSIMSVCAPKSVLDFTEGALILFKQSSYVQLHKNVLTPKSKFRTILRSISDYSLQIPPPGLLFKRIFLSIYIILCLSSFRRWSTTVSLSCNNFLIWVSKLL